MTSDQGTILKDNNISQPPVVNLVLSIKEGLDFKYGGFWIRLLALLIDLVCCGLIGGIFLVTFGGILGLFFSSFVLNGDMRILSLVIGGIINIAIFGAGWLYFTKFESSKLQATPGKLLLGLKVIGSNGNQITMAQANKRYWSKLISAIILMFGFLMAGFTKKKQALHDIFSATAVIKVIQQI